MTTIHRWTLALLVPALLALGACARLTGRATPTGPPVRVGIAPIYAPFASKTGGEIVGVEADFAARLADELGQPFTLHELLWDDLIPALRAGRIDVIMSGMSITDARAKLVNFTRPYLQVGQMALIRRADIDRLRDSKTMNQKTTRVGVHRNTTGEYYARRTLTRATVKTYDSVDAGIAALRAKEIDFFIHDAPTIWRVRGQLAEQYADLVGRYQPLTEEHLAWAVRHEDEALHGRLDAALERWEDSGVLDAVLDRWIPVRKVSVAVPR